MAKTLDKYVLNVVSLLHKTKQLKYKIMETLLNLKVENYEVVVNRTKQTSVIGLQTIEETGLMWSVWENGVVKAFDTFAYNENVYSIKEVAIKGIYWIANLEKTAKLRFEKSDELVFNYLD